MSRKPVNVAAESSGTPSDLELMLYADGELEEARVAEVEAYLEHSVEARSKVEALDLASALVREHASALGAKAGGFADAIMAQIEADAANEVKPASRAATAVPKLPATKAANDNSRGIFTLAVVAFAAAAGLLIWGRASVAPSPQARLDAPQSATAIAPNPAVPAPAPTNVVEVAEIEDEHGVEVASVNFGSRTGSIFYVPKGAAASNATTTVVWLNDNAAGEE